MGSKYKIDIRLNVGMVFALLYIYNAQSQITSLTQKTNFFISTDSYGLTWISSMDGVNVYTGASVKVYKPGEYNMIGRNVQSHFYEDCNQNMWFATYDAIHKYDRYTDQMKPYRFRDTKGAIIENMYRVIGYREQMVYIQMGDYLGVIDINTEKVVHAFQLGLSKFNFYESMVSHDALITTFWNSSDIKVISLNANVRTPPKSVDINTFQNINRISFMDTDNILITKDKSKIVEKYNLSNHQSNTVFVHPREITQSIYDRIYQQIVIVDNEKIYGFNLSSIHPKLLWEKKLFDKGSVSPINLYGDIVFYGIDGKGISFFDRKKQKFSHYSLEYQAIKSNTRSIIKARDGTFWYSSRDNGIGHFDSNGHDLGHYNTKNNTSPTDFVLRVVMLPNGKIFAGSGSDLMLYNERKDVFEKMSITNSRNHFFGNLCLVDNKDLLISDYNNFNHIYKIDFTNNSSITIAPITIMHGKPTDEYVDVTHVYKNYVIVDISASEAAYGAYKNDTLTIHHRWPIGGSVTSVTTYNGKLFLSASSGLYYVLPNDMKNAHKIIDTDNYLNQEIYAALPHHDFLFCSTNQGLLRYDTKQNIVHPFSLSDGLQELEYNSTGHYLDDNGTMIFGGVNGINVFHPDSIKWMTNTSKIYVSDILINDEKDSTLQNVSLTKLLNLDYDKNTISFSFNGIDYADPQAVKIKYILSNYDRDTLQINENKGFARYANVPPGSYTFKIWASNSDGIWSEVSHDIAVQIEPPFWRTIWFRLLMILTALGSGYTLTKMRYQRKLEKKNQLLREQALIIEKQQAIENERTRIASEMHDDLGSGLTTIRYLSEKAIKNTHDIQEKQEIQKISDQSNTLVSNMSEIIWALNSRFDNSDDFIAYLRRYFVEFLLEHQMKNQFTVEVQQNAVIISGEKRRNLFLVIKEILHNSVKYSKAEEIVLHVKMDSTLTITISEIQGVGFDLNIAQDEGNGLYNIQKRMMIIGGHLKTYHNSEGMHFEITCPIEPSEQTEKS